MNNLNPNIDQPECELSVVLTLYNFGAGIELLADAVQKHILDNTPDGFTYEILFVDDGSLDETEKVLERVCKTRKNIRSIVLFQNVGEEFTLSAGIHNATGKHIIVMDGDFENPIDQIIPLYNKIVNEDLDIVYTVTKTMQSFGRKVTSRLFYWTAQNIFKVKVIPNQLTMRIFTHQYAKIFAQYPERVRTLIAINQHIGGRSGVLKVTREQREIGSTNYNFIKRLEHYFTSIVALSASPLDFVFKVGLLTFLFAGLLGVVNLYEYFTQNILPGYTSLILAILFLGGIQLMCLGLIARYLSFVFKEVRARPLYQVRKDFKKNCN